ncbi:MAG: molecular chaperone TorD family protein [Planctomycetes bacterium]|nr:molecular chaperone TorD family protein [Planctomycetota bacterium]
MVAPLLYTAWRNVLAYPQDGNCAPLRCALEELSEALPELADALRPLRQLAAQDEPAVLEEAYMRTFDCNPDRALEVGWHLFGESYSRGNFLVRMRGFMRDCGIEEGVELPDHLCNVLGVVETADEGLSRAIRTQYLLPALAKLELGFRDDQDPYRGVIAALKRFVEAELGTARNEARDE